MTAQFAIEDTRQYRNVAAEERSARDTSLIGSELPVSITIGQRGLSVTRRRPIVALLFDTNRKPVQVFGALSKI